jgi:hypothetical protein
MWKDEGFNDLHMENATGLTSMSAGAFTYVNSLHNSKELYPMDVTESEIVTDNNLLHS